MNRATLWGLLHRLRWEATNRFVKASRGAINPSRYRDFDAGFSALLDEVRPYTMSLPESLFALREGVEYVVREGVPGDAVECGVWRGGSSMVIAKTLQRLGDSRRLWMYDTYQGMSPPGERDGQETIERYKLASRVEPFVAYASLAEVKANLRKVSVGDDRVTYVVGRVEDTIPGEVPERIALLRLDTDWYDSIRHELEYLWDRLSPGGVLLIDDYGFWRGVRAAVDDFFAERGSRPLLARLDYSSRLIVKLPENQQRTSTAETPRTANR